MRRLPVLQLLLAVALAGAACVSFAQQKDAPREAAPKSSARQYTFSWPFKPGDEILTTTQDYPRMLTTLRQREKRENLKLKLIQIPIPAAKGASR